MTVAYLCVLVAAILPIACAGIAKAGFRGYDNRTPRDWLARQEGFRRRADAAQANGFEALPLFAAAVVIAHQLGAPQARLDALAVAFVVARVVFIGLYVADMATLRSIAWVAGFGLSIAIFFSATW
jgi:uncharacterized MAPEG superfamily protein